MVCFLPLRGYTDVEDSSSSQFYGGIVLLAKMTRDNRLTLPEAVVGQLEDVDYFEVATEGERIILTPVHAKPGDKVREKLAELDITAEDIADAIAWARRDKQ